jgi:peroxiredoxin
MPVWRFDKSKVYSSFLHALALVLAIQVIVVTYQNRELRNSISMPAATVKVGTRLQLDSLRSLARGVGMGQSRFLLLFAFGTHCQFCRKNLPAWEALHDSIEHPSIVVAAISLDSMDATARFVQENRVNVPVYVSMDPDYFRRSNELVVIPQTLLLGEGHVVEKVWAGPLADSTIMEIRREVRRITSGGM